MATPKKNYSPIADSLLSQSNAILQDPRAPESAIANMLNAQEQKMAEDAMSAPGYDGKLGFNLKETFSGAVEAGYQQLEGDVKRFGAIYNLMIGDEEQAQKRLNQAEALSRTSGKILGDLGEFKDFVEEPTVDGFFTQVIKGIGQFTPMAVSSIASGFTGGAIATVGKGVLSKASQRLTGDMMASIVKKHALHKAGKGAALNANEKAILKEAYKTVQKAGQTTNYLNVAKAGQASLPGAQSAFNQSLTKLPKAGFWAGAFGQEYVVGSSQAAAEYQDAGYKLTKKEAAAALKLGIPQAVLGTLGEKLFVGALFKRAAKEVVEKGSKTAGRYMIELAKGFGGGLLQGGTQEGITELGQEELLIRQRMAIDPEYSQEEKNLRRGESAFIGFWAGGARSAPTSAIANVFGLARSNVDAVSGMIKAIKSGKGTDASKLEGVQSLTKQTQYMLDPGVSAKEVVLIEAGTAEEKAGYWAAIIDQLFKKGVINNKTQDRLEFAEDPDGTGFVIYDRGNPKSKAIADDFRANGWSEAQKKKNLDITDLQDASQEMAIVIRDAEGIEIVAESITNEAAYANTEKAIRKNMEAEGYTEDQINEEIAKQTSRIYEDVQRKKAAEAEDKDAYKKSKGRPEGMSDEDAQRLGYTTKEIPFVGSENQTKGQIDRSESKESAIQKLERKYKKQIAEDGWTITQEPKEDLIAERSKKRKAEIRNFEGEENIDPETGEIVDDAAFGSDLEMYGQEVSIKDGPEETTTVNEKLSSTAKGPKQRQARLREKRQNQKERTFPEVHNANEIKALDEGERTSARKERSALVEKFYDIIGDDERNTWRSKTIEEDDMATTGRINSVSNEALQAFINASNDGTGATYNLQKNKDNEWILLRESNPDSQNISIKEEFPDSVIAGTRSTFGIEQKKGESNQEFGRRIGERKKLALKERWSIKKPGKGETFKPIDITYLMDLAIQINQDNSDLGYGFTTDAGFVANSFDTLLDIAADQGYTLHFAGKPINAKDSAWATAPLYKSGGKSVTYTESISNRGEKGVDPDELTTRQAEALKKAGMDVKKGDPVPSSTELRKLLENIPQQVVEGGTGWAVQMAIDAGKPVYVFDGGKWYEWTTLSSQQDMFAGSLPVGKKGFIELKKAPDLTKDHAIIGTREAKTKFVTPKVRDAQGTIHKLGGAGPTVVVSKNTTADEAAGKGINVLRKKGEQHYGNPFSHEKGQTRDTIKTKNLQESVDKYKAWLEGSAHTDVKQERRNWVLRQIDSGALDNATLLYYSNQSPNHAEVLSAYIVFRRGEGAKPVPTNEGFIKQIRNQIAALYRGTDEIDQGADFNSYTNHSGGAVGVDSIGKEIGGKKGARQNHYYVEGKKTAEGNVEISKKQAKTADKALEKANETLNRKINKNFAHLLQRNFWQVKNSEAIFAFAPLMDNSVYIAIQRLLDKGLIGGEDIDAPKTQAEINLEERGILFTKLKTDPETGSILMENERGVLETISNVNLRTADEKRSKKQLGSTTVLGGTAKESKVKGNEVVVDSSIQAVMKGALPVLRSIVKQFFGNRNLRVLDINNVLNNPNAFVKTETKTKTTKKTTKEKTTTKPGKVEQRNIPNTEIQRTKSGARRTTLGVYTEDKVTVNPAVEEAVVEQETTSTPIEGYEAIFNFEGKDMKVSDILKLLAHKMKTEGGKGKWVKFGDTEVILLNIPEKATPAQLGDVVLTLAHELGHSIYNQTLNNMLTHKNMREKLQKAFETDKKRVGTAAYEGRHGFEEWFADQMGTWLTREMTQEGASANNVVDSFFKRLAKKLIGVFKQLDKMIQKRFTLNMDFSAYVTELSQAIRDDKPSVSVTQEIEIRNMVDDVLDGKHNDTVPKSLRVLIKNKAINALKSIGEKLPTDKKHWGVEYLLKPSHNVLAKIAERWGMGEFASMIYNPSQSKADTGTLNARISLMYMRLNDLMKLAPKKKNGEPDLKAWDATLKQAEDDQIPTAQLSQEAKKIRKFLDDFFADNIQGRDADIKYRDNFFPRIVDIYKIQENKNGERAALAGVIVQYNEGLSLPAAEAYVETMIKKYETNPDNPHDDVSDVSVGMAKARSEAFTNIPNSALRDIEVIQDPFVAITTYIQDMTKRMDYKDKVKTTITREDIANAKELADEIRQKNAGVAEKDRVKNPLGFLLQSDVSVGDPLEGWQATEVYLNRIKDPIDRAKARHAIKSMMGKVGLHMEPWARQISGALMSLNIITMLTFAALASLPDLGGTVMRSKDFSGVSAFWKQWKTHFKDREAANQFARDVGVISYDSLSTMYVNAHEMGFMGKWSNFASEKFFIATGLEAFTKFTRVFAAGMAEQFLARTAEKASDSSLTQIERDRALRHLEELKVSQNDIATWRKNKRSFESVEGEKVRAAIARFVDEAIVRPNSAERPGWASNPHFALIWQLKSFFYAYGKNIVGGAIREGKNRYAEDGTISSAALPLILGATALLPLTMLGLEIRELIKYFGRGMDPNVFQTDMMTWPQYSKEIIDRAGPLGAFGLVLPLLDAGKYGGQWWVPPFGPTAERIENIATWSASRKDYTPLYDLGMATVVNRL